VIDHLPAGRRSDGFAAFWTRSSGGCPVEVDGDERIAIEDELLKSGCLEAFGR
jgi:hypothetical protein